MFVNWNASPRSFARSSVESFLRAHDHCHHDPDNSGDMIAIGQRVIECLISSGLHIHLEAVEQGKGIGGRDPDASERPAVAPRRSGSRSRRRRRPRRFAGAGSKARQSDRARRHRCAGSRDSVRRSRRRSGGTRHRASRRFPAYRASNRRAAAAKLLEPAWMIDLLRLPRSSAAPVVTPMSPQRASLARMVAAVALAEPTTPGTPAPGCVPAPTR